MNQILSTANKNNKPNHIIDIKKIIIFFCAVIILFGIVLVSAKGYKIYTKSKQGTEVSTPDVKIEQSGEDLVRIFVSDNIGINKIIYYWNESDKNEIQVNGSKTIEKTIDLINGQNILTVEVVDKNGNSTKYTNEFTYYKDKTKPTIELSVLTEEAKVKITVQDETELAYITYKWGDSQETKIQANSEDPKKMETKLDIQRGTNKLVITAADTSQNIATKEQPFQGVNEPEIDAYQDGGIVYISVTHDMGFKKVEFIINDVTYTYDENYSGYSATQTKLSYTYELIPGENKFIINAYSLENTEKTSKLKCTYTP